MLLAGGAFIPPHYTQGPAEGIAIQAQPRELSEQPDAHVGDVVLIQGIFIEDTGADLEVQADEITPAETAS
ncbi:hypothetical protein HMPREF3120_04695 [Corynebacterium sp. HMSC11D10]|nr:hypothetical protein HMPREF3120_04695 [Corynebacterium sp. HMSC11D10]